MYCVSQLWHDTFLHQFRYTLTFMCINMHCIQAVFPHIAMIIYFVNNYTPLLYSPYAVIKCNLNLILPAHVSMDPSNNMWLASYIGFENRVYNYSIYNIAI